MAGVILILKANEEILRDRESHIHFRVANHQVHLADSVSNQSLRCPWHERSLQVGRLCHQQMKCRKGRGSDRCLRMLDSSSVDLQSKWRCST